jgi:integrase
MDAVYSIGVGEATRGEVAQPRKLLDQLRDVLRAKHYSFRTERAYVHWAGRYILFHGKRHPREMGAPAESAPCKNYSGHKDVATTMIYTHVLQRGASGATSPLDRL